MDRIENTVSNNTLIVVDVFSDPVLRNALHNPIVLLLLACMLRALPSNGCCLQKHRLTTGLFANIEVTIGIGHTYTPHKL
jgi:hypothetical protein